MQQTRSSSPPPLKRMRRTGSSPPPSGENGGSGSGTNGHASGSAQHTGPHRSSSFNDSEQLRPLSLSILGVEPLDEFIKEVADFVHHMIMNRPDIPTGKVEVEAKVGVLKDRMTGQRLQLPVLVETSEFLFITFTCLLCKSGSFFVFLSKKILKDSILICPLTCLSIDARSY